jgi:hypothetical protein
VADFAGTKAVWYLVPLLNLPVLFAFLGRKGVQRQYVYA